MSEPVVFDGLPKRKLEGLLAQGYQINGYCFQRIESDGSITRGAVTTGGMVLWWHPDRPPVKLSVTNDEDPCPGCAPGVRCRTPACGRLKKDDLRNHKVEPVEAKLNREAKLNQLVRKLEHEIVFGKPAPTLVGDPHESLTFHALGEGK
jgi:hypothetical protein